MTDTYFAPTSEQQAAIDLFATGQNLAIEAGAGTGKTSTLLLLAESAPDRRGQYLAFNRAIVDSSAEKFPASVRCNTAHQLAYKAVMNADFSRRLRSSQRMKSWDLAKILKLNPVTVTTFTDERKTLSPSFLAGLAMRSIDKFCQSADPEPTRRHVAYVDGLDAPITEHGLQRFDVNREVAAAIEPALRLAWSDLQLFHGALRFDHQHYLKIWQLSTPRIDADYILFDEAQDANPVMNAVVSAQDHAQLVWVGDSNQQIYSFTGAVNALAKVDADSRTFLTQSFRFGPAVAHVANAVLEHLPTQLRLTGTDEIPSTVEPLDAPDAVLCRTNATAVRRVLATLEVGQKPFLVGGGGQILSFARAAGKLMEDPPRRVEHPELACFDSWQEVEEYVSQDEQGGDLRLMVSLVNEFGVDRIVEALDQTSSTEKDADIVVSTAHKSKGREWDAVQLADDFPDEPKEEELRLLYVAATRAKLRLDLTRVGFLTRNAAGVAA